MKQKWTLAGTAIVLATALTGCGSTMPINTQQQSRQEQPQTQEQLQTQEQPQLISIEAAQEAALKAANIAVANAAISATTLSETAGIVCYKVAFTSGKYTYDYSINAETGAVMEMSSRDLDVSGSNSNVPAPTQTVTGTGTVDEAKAQEIALNHAGVKAADATITKSRLDYDDRRQVYEIEWYADGAKYDYEIAADTGEIIKAGYEEKTVVTNNSTSGTVSEADARKTVLDRVSGATERDLYEWKFDYDDGIPEYEGKIIYGGVEYEFTIDATNGSVIEWDAESVR